MKKTTRKNIRMYSSPAYTGNAIRQIGIAEKRRAQAKKDKVRLIRDIIIAIVVGVLIGFLTGCQAETAQTAPVTEQTVDANDVVETPSSATEPANIESTTPAEETHEMPTATGSWHNATKSHDITVNTILKYDDKAICNFNDTIAVGVCAESDVVSTTETESGFILSVIDDDSVKVSFYNYGTDYIKPTKLTAEMSVEDYVDDTGATEYTIAGYSACENGFGVIEMTLSNGYVIRAGILREDGKLYAANLVKNQQKVQNIVDFRVTMDTVLAKNNIRPDNSTYTEPIYYPIVPVASNERTDVDFWVQKSNELVEDDWTDAHKVKAFYDFVIETMAYDYWVVDQGSTNRSYYYKVFDGTYFTSKTNVGVCEDFANIIAIMCRAQNIPATKVFTQKHAWDYIYIADYGRWISVDATRDMFYGCYSEDTSAWKTVTAQSRYTTFDNISTENAHHTNLDACIGNDADMKKQGKTPVELQ